MLLFGTLNGGLQRGELRLLRIELVLLLVEFALKQEVLPDAEWAQGE